MQNRFENIINTMGISKKYIAYLANIMEYQLDDIEKLTASEVAEVAATLNIPISWLIYGYDEVIIPSPFHPKIKALLDNEELENITH